MSDEISFKHETVQDTESLRKYLKAVEEGIAKGHIKLSASDQELELSPQGMIRFDIESKLKGDRRKLTLKFTWKEEVESERYNEPLIIE